MADIWQVYYRDFLAIRDEDYRLRLLAQPALAAMKQASIENWSLEKLALQLDADVSEARDHYGRFLMSDKVHGNGEGGDAAERLQRAFDGILASVEPEEGMRKKLSGELCRLVANHLQLGEMDGETWQSMLEHLMALGAKNSGPSLDSPGENRSWGPQWKD
jgi:hypothetical protein